MGREAGAEWVGAYNKRDPAQNLAANYKVRRKTDHFTQASTCDAAKQQSSIPPTIVSTLVYIVPPPPHLTTLSFSLSLQH